MKSNRQQPMAESFARSARLAELGRALTPAAVQAPGQDLEHTLAGVISGMVDNRSNTFVEARNGLLQQAELAARGFRTAQTTSPSPNLRMSKFSPPRITHSSQLHRNDAERFQIKRHSASRRPPPARLLISGDMPGSRPGPEDVHNLPLENRVLARDRLPVIIEIPAAAFKIFVDRVDQ